MTAALKPGDGEWRERERTLERSHYRSSFEVLERYGVHYEHLERWRERAVPPFPPAVEVVGENDCFFHFLGLIRWEMGVCARHKSVQRASL